MCHRSFCILEQIQSCLQSVTVGTLIIYFRRNFTRSGYGSIMMEPKNILRANSIHFAFVKAITSQGCPYSYLVIIWGHFSGSKKCVSAEKC